MPQQKTSKQMPSSLLSGLSIGSNVYSVTYRYEKLGVVDNDYYTQDFTDFNDVWNFIENEIKPRDNEPRN